MTVLERVQHVLAEISPRAICDDCLAKKVELSVRQHANHKSRQLAKDKGYLREKETCPFCGDHKLVIRERPS